MDRRGFFKFAAAAVVTGTAGSTALALITPPPFAGRGFKVAVWGRDPSDRLAVLDVIRITRIDDGFRFDMAEFHPTKPCTAGGITLIDPRGRTAIGKRYAAPVPAVKGDTLRTNYTLTADRDFDTPEALVDAWLNPIGAGFSSATRETLA